MNKTKVMVVDDHLEILDFFKNALHILNFDSVLVSNGIEALKVFAREKPDIVFLDIKMPFIDGIETLKRMKYLDEENRTVVIMLTGYGDMETARQAMRLGAYDYITKPVNLSLIESICKEVVEEKVVVHA